MMNFIPGITGRDNPPIWQVITSRDYSRYCVMRKSTVGGKNLSRRTRALKIKPSDSAATVARKSAGYTVVELSTEIGISVHTVYHIERGGALTRRIYEIVKDVYGETLTLVEGGI